MVKFTVEEINFMCVYKNKTRLELISHIGQVFKYIEQNEMGELAKQIVNKLRSIGDEEYQELIFEPAEDYRIPLF